MLLVHRPVPGASVPYRGPDKHLAALPVLGVDGRRYGIAPGQAHVDVGDIAHEFPARNTCGMK
jgi:hypothetical protein